MKIIEIEEFIKQYIEDCAVDQLLDLYNLISPDKLELNDVDYTPEG